MDDDFFDRNFKRWRQPTYWSVEEKVETAQGSVIIHFVWDVFEDPEAWVYQRYLESENTSTLRESYEILKDETGKLAEIYFTVSKGSIYPEELNTRNRARVMFKVKEIFYDNICYPKKDYKPDPGDILVGYPFAVSMSSRMFNKAAPGGAKKRSLLYQMGGMSDIKNDKYQYGKYNNGLRIEPL